MGRCHCVAEQKHLIFTWKILDCLVVMLLLEVWLCQLQLGLSECCCLCVDF